jgi:hypothetical protein
MLPPFVSVVDFMPNEERNHFTDSLLRNQGIFAWILPGRGDMIESPLDFRFILLCIDPLTYHTGADMIGTPKMPRSL